MNRTPLASAAELFDPTVPAPPVVDVGAYGFEGRLDALADDWSADARYWEYTKAANPIGSGQVSAIPAVTFPAALHAGGPTRVVPLDLAERLHITDGPATSPALLANFVRVDAGDRIALDVTATSQLFYVMYGRGTTVAGGRISRWEKGDFLVLPAMGEVVHHADADTLMYWVHDEPLLRHLGVAPTGPRFRPTKFSRERAVAELDAIANAPGANARNRVSVLLNNADQDRTLTVTHVLWAMFGLLPVGQIQRPHRHQSVALDLILDCEPGCYSLLGERLDERGDIVDPVRVDWEPGGAFVTPPGMWHAHHNESGAPAHLIPVQDAGLQTYLRSLDIRFTDRR
ncbi:cupin domain-containing protein [Yinghuangia sp. ASG 101]|uniref:cupin domain-containing protein n=1 Tax=Yinghuangia sp. ASG 101 TaxID=2896848 RepID=UPI001E630695|nr:cupin domain-containing protein [Yinghuangia sp. ASG 101]UGQ11956.1 cupin domain-containing protein [Yinghuangia sp. ASG 101]